MPKNTSKTGKSSKTARVLSLLTDPAASLLGGSRNHKDEGQDDETEVLDASASRGLDDAATESRIQASLAAEEDSLVTELFGKQNPPSRARQTPAQTPDNASDTAYLVPPQSAPPQQAAAPAQEPDPRTLELLSMLSNPTTLGNSAMPSYTEEEPLRPAALDMDFADELTAGMAEQPASLRAEPEPEPAPPPVQRPAAQPVRQAAPQPFAQSPAPSVRQPAQSAQRPAPQPAAQSPAPQSAPRPAAPQDHEEFVCFNLTQALVEDKADRLMKQFGMCTCNRCKVDVTAIALSNLPAKYVAMQNRDILPLLSMYEEKYSAAVTVQVMSACRMVMKRPHHGR